MSTMEPDGLEDLFASLDFGEPETPDDLTLLSNVELVNRFNATAEELKALEELTGPRTTTGQALHSVHDACVIIMVKRGLR